MFKPCSYSIYQKGKALKTAGIVAEFNPFHTGHKYLLDKVREKGFTHILVCLSSDITQRGDIAIFDRHKRAECAIRCGADLVVELPVPFSMSSAEIFAKKALEILKKIGIDALFFGSETDDKNALINAAQFSRTIKCNKDIKTFLKSGESYPSAVYKTAVKLIGCEAAKAFKDPNSTLAIEYINALGDTSFFPVIRTVPHDGEPHEDFAPASFIRKGIINKDNDVYKYLPYRIKDLAAADIKNTERAVLLSLYQKNTDELSSCYDINDDLAHRIFNALRTAKSYEELISGIKTKAYTMARIKRCVFNAYLGITKSDITLTPYIRPLAANEKGKEIMSSAKCEMSPSLKELSENHPRLCELSEASHRLFDMSTNYPTGQSEYSKRLVIN